MVRKIYTYLTFCFFIGACTDNNCILPPGDETTKMLYPSSVNNLIVEANAIVHLYNDTVPGITLKGPEMLVDQYVLDEYSENGSDITKIVDENTCRFVNNYEKISIHAYTNNWQSFTSRESVYAVSMDTIEASKFTVIAKKGGLNEMNFTLKTSNFRFYNSHNVGGIYKFSGTTSRAHLTVDANARLNTNDLVANYCLLEQASVVDCYIGPTDSLAVSIKNAGNVYYLGSPKIRIIEISGDGELIPISQ